MVALILGVGLLAVALVAVFLLGTRATPPRVPANETPQAMQQRADAFVAEHAVQAEYLPPDPQWGTCVPVLPGRTSPGTVAFALYDAPGGPLQGIVMGTDGGDLQHLTRLSAN